MFENKGNNWQTKNLMKRLINDMLQSWKSNAPSPVVVSTSLDMRNATEMAMRRMLQCISDKEHCLCFAGLKHHHSQKPNALMGKRRDCLSDQRECDRGILCVVWKRTINYDERRVSACTHLGSCHTENTVWEADTTKPSRPTNVRWTKGQVQKTVARFFFYADGIPAVQALRQNAAPTWPMVVADLRSQMRICVKCNVGEWAQTWCDSSLFL